MKLPLVSCCRLAAASLIALSSLDAGAALVFQADFNGVNNIVTYGGTGAVLNVDPASSKVTASIASGTPLAVGSGSYLSLNDQGAHTNTRAAGVAFTPASAANSFDSWYADTSGTAGHDSLNGGFDFLFRTSSTAALNTNTFRFFDADGGNSGYRITLASAGTNNLTLTLRQAGNAFVSAATTSAAGTSVNLAANTTYRIAGTVSTDANGYVTLSLYLAQGDTAIDTSSATHRIATGTSATKLDAGNSISSSFNSAGGFNFGQLANPDADVKTLDLDSFRLYDAAPATFDAISIPEPGSSALILGLLVGAGGAVRRRR